MSQNLSSQNNTSIMVIAEIANTHNGDFERMLSLIDAAKKSGADAVKFQIFKVSDLVTPDHPEYDIFCKLEFSVEQWREIIGISEKSGLSVFSDIFGVSSLRLAQEQGIEGIKIHSSDLLNIPLLEASAQSGLPIFLGIGGTTPGEVWKALHQLNIFGARELILLLGYQAFPTPLEELQLKRIEWYKKEFGLPVGYADHVDGASRLAAIIPVVAVSLGAHVIEKHLTINRIEKPEDYEAALEPEEFRAMVDSLRKIPTAIGSGDMTLSLGEKSYALRMKKYPIAARSMENGDLLTADSIGFTRIHGVSIDFPFDPTGVIGKQVSGTIVEGDILRSSMLHNHIAALLNARMESRRLPGKALMPIAGRPALAWLVERLRACKLIQSIILCTTHSSEDDVLVEFAKEQGIVAFRGETEDVMGRLLGAASHFSVDHIVRVTGDDILTAPEYVDIAVKEHLFSNAEYTAVCGLPVGMDREVIKTSTLQWIHANAADLSKTEYMTWFLDDPARVRCKWIEAPSPHYRPSYRLTLDTKVDFDLIEGILQQLVRSNLHLDTSSIISLLDERRDKSPEPQGGVPISRELINTTIKWNHF